jgi:hypothetical protein
MPMYAGIHVFVHARQVVDTGIRRHDGVGAPVRQFSTGLAVRRLQG